MEQNILYSMGKEGASNLVSLLSKSLEPVVDMHNNDCVIRKFYGRFRLIRSVLRRSNFFVLNWFGREKKWRKVGSDQQS